MCLERRRERSSWRRNPSARCASCTQVSETDLGAEKVRSKPGDRTPAANGAQAQRLARGRVVASAHPRELGGVDVALKAEEGGGVTGPLALGLALTGVVVLGAFGDLSV